VAEQTCPNCGADLPSELLQHAVTPVSGLVQCPSCGETVKLGGPEQAETVSIGEDDVPDQSGEPESFSGEETIEGVMDELADKPGGPGSDE
jgi:uncharacterized Zn finger protein